MLNHSVYDIASKSTASDNVSQKEYVLATKIKVIITEHDVENDNEYLIYNEIIKLKEEEKATEQQIVTALGSVRGIKNRVRDRIGHYLSGCTTNQKYPSESSSNELQVSTRDSLHKVVNDNKIIIYTTSLGIIRKTRADCLYVINAFRSLMLKTEERDIVSKFYHKDFFHQFPNNKPPQVIINSYPIGGRKEVEELVESGEIHLLTKDIDKVEYTAEKCSKCLGYGYLNCPFCLGSGRSKTVRIGNTRELSSLKCSYCKEGLIRCVDCINMVN